MRPPQPIGYEIAGSYAAIHVCVIRPVSDLLAKSMIPPRRWLSTSGMPVGRLQFTSHRLR